MRIFTLNAGSSSIKFKLFKITKETIVLAYGEVKKIGEEISFLEFNGKKKEIESKNHKEALKAVIDKLKEENILDDFTNLDAIAHRVVHGGDKFYKATIIDKSVIADIKETTPLAPLHNPANLEGILAMQALAPKTPQIAFFDTAFHHSMPKESYLYALPQEFYKHYKIRRYGFHGISYSYLSKKGAELLNKPLSESNLVILHLGNGASITAIKNGKSLKTSMGFTPLEGLVMGTRSGDIDAGVLIYLLQEHNFNANSLNTLLNKQSGLKGLCGINDMQEITQKMLIDKNAKLAFNIFCQRAKEYIGAYVALLNRVDAIIFSGGIGFNSIEVREAICSNLDALNIFINKEKNKDKNCTFINAKNSIKILKIETNEELEMALEALRIIQNVS